MKALVFGASGQVGRAVAVKLAAEGWRVSATTRDGRSTFNEVTKAGVRIYDHGGRSRMQVIRAIGATFDLVVDANAYTESDGQELVAAQSAAGAIVTLSSSSVYADGHGRSLDEANETGFPDFPDPIVEETATVNPGPETYSTQKVAMERAVMQARIPVVILRPCAIYGIGGRHFREWWFLRRGLDRRKAIPLAYDGESLFHTSSVGTLTEVVHRVGQNPVSTILNVADSSAPTVREIAAAIESATDLPLPLKPFPGTPPDGTTVGDSPWGAPTPFVLDVSRMEALLEGPTADYATEVVGPCRWALDAVRKRPGDDVFAVTTKNYRNLAAYDAEDRFLASLG